MILNVVSNEQFNLDTQNHEYLVLDVETTSFTKTEFRIIEIALIVINAKGERLKSWHSLVNPECKVTFTKVHGLTDEDIKNAPKFINLATYIANELQNRILVGHNISYDYGVLKSEFARIGIKMPSLPRICTLQMCYDLELPLENVTLSTVRKELEIPEGLAHSALHDTAATTAVFASLLKLYELRHVNILRAFSGPNPENIEGKDWMPQQLFDNEFFTQERKNIDVASVAEFPIISKAELLNKFSRSKESAELSQRAQSVCPSCQKGLVVIKNKYAGGQFKGCSRYPACRFSQDL